jgi:hypothetical protein
LRPFVLFNIVIRQQRFYGGIFRAVAAARGENMALPGAAGRGDATSSGYAAGRGQGGDASPAGLLLQERYLCPLPVLALLQLQPLLDAAQRQHLLRLRDCRR